MPWNGSGSYTIVNTFTPNTVISSSAMNANFSDIATDGFAKTLPRDGQAAMTGQFKAIDGTVGAPGMAFSADTDNGLRRSATNEFKAVTAGADAATWDANQGYSVVGNLSGAKQLIMSGDLSPAQITANQNDYNPTNLANAFTLRLSTDASRNITGLAGGAGGRVIVIHNVGSFDVVLTNDDSASSAANRFLLGANTTIGANKSLTLKYDATSSRWRAIDNAVNVGDGTITPVKLHTTNPAAPQAPVNLALAASVAGNALTIALKGEDGNDPSATNPVLIPTRSGVAATGTPVWSAITSALSLVISSGSTLGASNGVAFRVWIVLFRDAGTLRIGAINCLNGQNIFPLGQFPVASSTAEGGAGAADSAHVFYTGTAVSSKTFAILGYLTYESGLTTAGTWDTGPTRIQLHFPGLPLPGAIIQTAVKQDGATATGTTTTPFDDTIPQNTEGNEFLTQAITPTSAANVLDIEALLMLSSTVDNRLVLALHQDSVADALSVMTFDNVAADRTAFCPLRHSVLAGTTSATTIKTRAGGTTASTIRLNGESGRLFGGRAGSRLSVAELMA